MEECIEISSDSSCSDRTITSDVEINELIKKYTVPSCSKYSDNLYTLDVFSDEHINLKSIEDNTESESITKTINSHKSKDLNDFSPQHRKFDNVIYGSSLSKELSQLINNANISEYKEHERVKRVQEKEQKRVAKYQDKELKHALKVVENSMKPDKCLEYISIKVGQNVLNKSYGEVIKTGFKEGNYNFKCSKEIHPNMISWIREIPIIKNNLLQREFQHEHHYLLIMEIDEFLNHIAKKTLIEYIQSLLKLKEIRHLSIVVMGLSKYIASLRNQNKGEFESNHVVKKPTQKEINTNLVELQIFCKNIYVKFLDKNEDLITFIIECTKAVAQIPYKKMKADALSCENEFFNGNNKDCVKVDKNGNGLSRLWNQCLRMFPLASLETAEAITSVYPTMESLIRAYEEIDSEDAKEKLLQDITVRRTAGPLGASKRIGPELSRKIYRFFNYEENGIL
ncbi:hypothetical protein GWI33_018605 [Rhynchophorus ferrugineus]|uniref:Crossover junction endonuclease EME1 n=1 Tax=Rhynchophorus ferrugineus TaxID=354439 RepID=A0A834I706_RHYFE|nr:hypothetical protein GWI33_018605 [Rhynchophorus ferrugineus]